MKKYLILLSKLFFIYCFSGGLYLMIETLFRWYTDLSMYYLAGFLGLIGFFLNNIFSYNMDFILQCSICTMLSTIAEGIVGNLINLDYHIWDYRNLPLSFWNDQINILFIFLWFVLFFFSIPLLDYIGWKCWNEKKPYYVIFGKKINIYK